ncbi:hypothetical protein [Dyadobacter jiangsuensis]|uniref:hypothetical protein n=1 Tax=Dyadobacter jiangsuensis TaxID=1591085 RepID=UPI00147606A9|nr:hypothetical protein [Dyadobacter jiangsuensis]
MTHLWPYLSQAWQAFKEKKPIRQVRRPATNKPIAGGLAFLVGILWTWLYFRD